MRLRTSFAFIFVGIFTLGVAACSSQKAPAEAAIKAAQEAYAPVSAEAQKYVPDQASAVQASIAAAQDAFNKGDFPTAQSKAQAASAQISALGPAIAGKKTELTTQWTHAGDRRTEVDRSAEKPRGHSEQEQIAPERHHEGNRRRMPRAGSRPPRRRGPTPLRQLPPVTSRPLRPMPIPSGCGSWT